MSATAATAAAAATKVAGASKVHVVSAPGKVLLTGGYLILEQPNTGLTAAVSARFRTRVTVTKPAESLLPSGSASRIIVRSPQFGETRSYAWHTPTPEDGSLVLVDGSPNSYIGWALTYALGAAAAAGHDAPHGSVLDLVLAADNDFYSQREALASAGLPISTAGLAALDPYLALDMERELVKTGLGSSAGLITSLVGAILVALGVVTLAPETASDGPANLDRQMVHLLAQAAHCAAQGKIGSGFDVSSASYGSQRYMRFSPSVLSELGSLMGESWDSPFNPQVLAQLPLSAMDSTVEPWHLPPSMHLVLGDCGVGSSTPGMVRKVLAWRRSESPDVESVWGGLAKANKRVEAALAALVDASCADALADAYASVVAVGSQVPLADLADAVAAAGGGQPEAAVVAILVELRDAFEGVRALLRELSRVADVPVEPPAQTKLLDATLALPGVIFAGVPGAGGFDAVFVGVLGSGTRDVVGAAWQQGSQEDGGVVPLVLDEDSVGGVVEEASSVLDVLDTRL